MAASMTVVSYTFRRFLAGIALTAWLLVYGDPVGAREPGQAMSLTLIPPKCVSDQIDLDVRGAVCAVHISYNAH